MITMNHRSNRLYIARAENLDIVNPFPFLLDNSAIKNKNEKVAGNKIIEKVRLLVNCKPLTSKIFFLAKP